MFSKEKNSMRMYLIFLKVMIWTIAYSLKILLRYGSSLILLQFSTTKILVLLLLSRLMGYKMMSEGVGICLITMLGLSRVSSMSHSAFVIEL